MLMQKGNVFQYQLEKKLKQFISNVGFFFKFKLLSMLNILYLKINHYYVYCYITLICLYRLLFVSFSISKLSKLGNIGN